MKGGESLAYYAHKRALGQMLVQQTPISPDFPKNILTWSDVYFTREKETNCLQAQRSNIPDPHFSLYLPAGNPQGKGGRYTHMSVDLSHWFHCDPPVLN